MVRLTLEQTNRLCYSALRQVGASEEEAEICARVMVDTSLRQDTHGVDALPRYVREARAGRIKPGAPVKVVSEGPAVTRLDGGFNFGHVIGVRAMELAIEKARSLGLGAAVCFHCNHYGAAAYYAMMPLKRDIIGISMTNSSPRVVPYGGREGLHGTNPMAFAFPTRGEFPIVLDIATSATAVGTAAKTIAQKGKIPEGWVLNKEGNPTTDPRDLVEGWLLPMAEHKGYGLGLVVDILTGGLAGSYIGRDFPPLGDMRQPYGGCIFMLALDISRFIPLERYYERVERLVADAKGCPPAEGFEEVLLPGELEYRRETERQQAGIPFDDDKWVDMLDQLEEHGVDVTPWRALESVS